MKKHFITFLVLLIALFISSCGNDMPTADGGGVGITDDFTGTWKSSQKCMFSRVSSYLDTFEDYIYLSFSDGKVVVYVPQKGSTARLPYTYEKAEGSIYYLKVTENGVIQGVSVVATNDTYSFTNLNSISVANGLVGAPQMVRISSTADIAPGLAPGEEP